MTQFTRTIHCDDKISSSSTRNIFQQSLRPSNEDMLFSTQSCKWGVTLTVCSACEKWKRIKSKREKLREGQIPKSRSCLSWGAMTKNNHPLCQSISPLLETNNNPLLYSCGILQKTGEWAHASGINIFITCGKSHLEPLLFSLLLLTVYWVLIQISCIFIPSSW